MFSTSTEFQWCYSSPCSCVLKFLRSVTISVCTSKFGLLFCTVIYQTLFCPLCSSFSFIFLSFFALSSFLSFPQCHWRPFARLWVSASLAVAASRYSALCAICHR